MTEIKVGLTPEQIEFLKNDPYYLKNYCKIKEWKKFLLTSLFYLVIYSTLLLFTNLGKLNPFEAIYFGCLNYCFIDRVIRFFSDEIEYKKYNRLDIYLMKLGIFNQRFYR